MERPSVGPLPPKTLPCVLPANGSDNRWCFAVPGPHFRTGSQRQSQSTLARSVRPTTTIARAPPIFMAGGRPTGDDHSREVDDADKRWEGRPAIDPNPLWVDDSSHRDRGRD